MTKGEFQKGGKRAQMGEERIFGGKSYVKTPNGWRPKPKGKSVKIADDHVFVDSKSQRYVIDTLDPDSGEKKFKPGDRVSWIDENTQMRVFATVHPLQQDDVHGLTDFAQIDTPQSIRNWLNGNLNDTIKELRQQWMETEAHPLQRARINATSRIKGWDLEKNIPVTHDWTADTIIEKISKTSPNNHVKLKRFRQQIASEIAQLATARQPSDGPSLEDQKAALKRADAYLTAHQAKRNA